jgi:hypothetical protein
VSEKPVVVSGVVVAPNGAQLWVSHDQPVNIAFIAGDGEHAGVYVNGERIAAAASRLRTGGVEITETAVFERALTWEDIQQLGRGGDPE